MGRLGDDVKVVRSGMKEMAAGVFLPGSNPGQGGLVLAKNMPG